VAEIGYALSSEEHGPRDLVANAAKAERAGFGFLMVSDHFHPWTNEQGNSPFVWSVIGAIAQVTERAWLGTGVTCPTIRIHPAIIAQAAATSAALMPGRFRLGVGTGENLNEHILGDHWPETDVRREMLEEAIEVMRLLWQGGMQSWRGKHYTVEQACIYSLPEEPPDVFVAASGPKSIELAGRVGDGYIGLAPEEESVAKFRGAGGAGKPVVGQIEVCWAKSEDAGVETAYEWWPQTALGGELTYELKLPAHFEQACEQVSPDDVREAVVCGPDVDRHVEGIREFLDAGYTHVYVHQLGPDQDGFISFYEREVLPRLSS
jgi:coenzyme F420-dependent glucose-6-phosphate dehydrogenase